MVTEVVVTTARAVLTAPMIEGGRAAYLRICERMPVVAAFWLYLDDRNRWRLHIASPLVGEQGPLAAYRQIQIAVEEAPGRQPYGLNALEVDDIAAIDAGDELVRLLRRAYPGGVRSGGARAYQITIAGHYFEDVYLYHLAPQRQQ